MKTSNIINKAKRISAAVIAVVLVVMLMLSSCAKNSDENNNYLQNDGQSDTVEDAASEQTEIDDTEPAEQIRNHDDIDAMNLLFADDSLAQYINTDDAQSFELNDITSNEVYSASGCQIFKTASEYESFIIADDEMYHIGNAKGGFGISYVDTCDFDDNGIEDIIYMYSYEQNGVFTIEVSCFDRMLKAEKLLYTYESVHGYSELILQKNEVGGFTVYSTKLSDENNQDQSFVIDSPIAVIDSSGTTDYVNADDGSEWAE